MTDAHSGTADARNPSPAASNELIVSQEYVSLVRRALRDIGYTSADPKTADISVELGLIRLFLKPVRAASEPSAESPEFADTTAIEKTLRRLEQRFKQEYDGWVPPIAVNHVMDHVAIVGEVTFGGDGLKVRTASGNWPPRSAGPGQGVRVGVADTRLIPQPWMAGGWSARYSDQDNDVEPVITAGHATFVTGLILYQAPGATVEIRNALRDDGTANVWDVAKQIVSFGSSGADVLNLSFACYTDDNVAPLALSNAINRLHPETVVVAAAGNLPARFNGRFRPAWPAAFDRVVAVGAANPDGSRAEFSPDEAWVDLLAPGVDVQSTFLKGRARLSSGGKLTDEEFDGFATWSGTSFAAALVSGTIAAAVQPGRISARHAFEDILQSSRQLDPSNEGRPTPPLLRIRLPR
jgi:membrane-anchored mycosin MYCP